jgi:hypothetical protein
MMKATCGRVEEKTYLDAQMHTVDYVENVLSNFLSTRVRTKV